MTLSGSRQSKGVTVVDIKGSITLDEGSAVLRKTVKELTAQGHRNILLNLAGVTSIDSSGIGELVSAFTTIRGAGGELKLLNPAPGVSDLLEITKLSALFDVHDDESVATGTFGQ
jgi:anti-sigma B factor antagonist